MAVQTTFTILNPLAYAGLVADAWHGRDIANRIAGSLDGYFTGLNPGLAVVRVSDSNVVVHPTTTLAAFEGVVTHVDKEPSDPLFPEGDVVGILKKGRIWCVFENPEATTLGSTTLFVRVVAAGDEQLGAFRTDADGSDAVALTGAKVTAIDTVSGLVEISFNLV